MLEKSLDHKKAIMEPVERKQEDPIHTPSDEDTKNIKYGLENVPGAFGTGHNLLSDQDPTIGYLEKGNKKYVVRHGSAATRSNAQYNMAQLLDADNMIARSSYNPDIHHPKGGSPHTHQGTSYQEHVKGKDIIEGAIKGKHQDSLRKQWQSGELHKLWALHYISNDLDCHGGNFFVHPSDGVKCFDSNRAFFELPFSHAKYIDDNGNERDHKSPNDGSSLPSYVKPFVKRDTETNEAIKPIHSEDKPDEKAISDYASMINPELFSQFGPHAVDRANKVKAALSSNPTENMYNLWTSPEETEEKEDGRRE